MLVADHVTKVYSSGTRANDDISLDVRSGEILGLLGPAGSGKTTLAKQLVGLLRPTSGSLRLAGSDLAADPAAARRLCSYLPQGPIPVGSLRVRDAIELTGFIRGCSRSVARSQASRLIGELDLADQRDTLVLKLPAGLSRLVEFAMATIRPGILLVLDEPTKGISPQQRRLLWTQIRRLRETGAAILLLTSDPIEAERLGDRLAILHQGRIMLEGKPSELTEGNSQRLRLRLVLTPGQEPPAPPSWGADHLTAGDEQRVLIDKSQALEAIAWAQARIDDGVAQGYELSPASLASQYDRLTATVAPDVH